MFFTKERKFLNAFSCEGAGLLFSALGSNQHGQCCQVAEIFAELLRRSAATKIGS
jgi:hypothetical protein